MSRSSASSEEQKPPALTGAAPSFLYEGKQTEYSAWANRQGVALCLSGGGFRAALFHLGALRCLNDLGLLSRLRGIASVSGGSVLAAVLATRLSWPLTEPVPSDDWENLIARPFRQFVSRDRRTRAFLLGMLPGKSSVEYFADEVAELVGGATVRDLPTRPEFIICATDLTFGSLWRFERNQVGDEQLGFHAPVPPYDSLALAVAISACIAPIFAPHLFPVEPNAFQDGRVSRGDQLRNVNHVALNDGGTYDNLGLEAVWRDYETILISDGGAPLFPLGRTRFPRLRGRTLGSSDLNDQMGRLARRRWFISNVQEKIFKGAYWGIGSIPADHYQGFQFGYSHEFVRNRVSRIRTDLDRFSVVEQCILENHGYTVAFASIMRWAGIGLGLPFSSTLPGPLPHPDASWTDEIELDRALVSSHRRFRWRS